MRYFKIIEDGYIMAIGENTGGEEISEEEYNQILEIIHNAPKAPEGKCYKLKTDLTWEECEIVYIETDNEGLEPPEGYGIEEQ